MKSWSRLEWAMSRFQHFRTQITGLIISHRKAKMICSLLVSTLILEDHSSQHKRIHITTHLLNGSSHTWKLATKSLMQRDLPYFQSSTNNLVLTMIVQKEKVWDLRNILVLKFSWLTCRKCLRNGVTKKFSWWRQLFVQRPCLVKLIAIFYLRVSTGFTKWRIMNFSS